MHSPHRGWVGENPMTVHMCITLDLRSAAACCSSCWHCGVHEIHKLQAFAGPDPIPQKTTGMASASFLIACVIAYSYTRQPVGRSGPPLCSEFFAIPCGGDARGRGEARSPRFGRSTSDVLSLVRERTQKRRCCAFGAVLASKEAPGVDRAGHGGGDGAPVHVSTGRS